MGEQKNFVCIGCPVGCPLQLTHEGAAILEIEGHECNRGAKYARQEFTDPRRSLSTTIAIEGAHWRRLPVKVSTQIPKDRSRQAVERIHGLRVCAPVRVGQVLLRGVLDDPEAEVVACRTMQRVQRP